MLDDYNKKKLYIGLTIAIFGTILSFAWIPAILNYIYWFVENTSSTSGNYFSQLAEAGFYIGLTIAFLLVSMVGYSIVFSSKNK